MKVAVASDHGGYAAKEAVKSLLSSMGIAVTDFGTDSGESVDYPEYGFRVAEAVASKKFDRGILVCGTGIGMSVVANKVKGIRAALCSSPEAAKLSREHNDSNILCLGGRLLDGKQVEEIVRVWVSTGFSGDERHVRRIQQISAGEARWLG